MSRQGFELSTSQTEVQNFTARQTCPEWTLKCNCHVLGVPWLILTGSGSDLSNTTYFTITLNHNLQRFTINLPTNSWVPRTAFILVLRLSFAWVGPHGEHVKNSCLFARYLALGMGRTTQNTPLLLSECVFIGPLPSTGNGVGSHRKHLFKYICCFCVRIFRPLHSNVSTSHSTTVQFCCFLVWV